MRWLPGSLATRLSQPQGRVQLLPELAALSPGAFLGSQPSHLIGGGEGPLTLQNVARRPGQMGMAFGGNGTNATAYRQWAGVNANTSPAVTLLVVFKNNGGSGQQIAGFGSSSGGPGSTLFRLVQGLASADAVLFQAQDSAGIVYLNNESSDFGAADGKYHAVVVTGQFGGAGTTATFYADSRKLNTIPALADNTPSNTNFDFLAVLSTYRGGAPLGFSNTDVALFLPLIGVQMPEEWCLQVTANPWRIFAPESRSIWVPSLGGGTTPVVSDFSASYAVRTAASRDLSANYAVRAAVTSDLSANYTVRSAAQQDLSASYAIRGAASQDLAASYAVRTSAAQTLSAGYAVRGTAAADLTAAFAIRGAAQQDLSASYVVRGSAAQNLSADYAVRGSAQAGLSASYTIENAGVVLSDFSAAYAVLGSVERDLSASYSILQPVQQDLSAAYTVRGSASQTLTGSYDILGSVSSDLSASWVVRGAVSRDLAGSYVIQSSGGGSADPAAVWGYLLGNGLTAEQTLLKMATQIDELHRIHGLQIAFPLTTTDTSRGAGSINQSVSDDGTTTTVQRL